MDIVTYALLKGKVGTLEKALDELPSGFSYKGSVATEADLPTTANKGDMYTVTSYGGDYVYDGTQWVQRLAMITDAQIDALFE